MLTCKTTYHIYFEKSSGVVEEYKIFNIRNNILEFQWDNELDFSQAKGLCENRKNMAGFWKQSVLPIRTDRVSDLFFPALMNMVLKTERLSRDLFSIIAAIVWDLATLPIRFITFLPRVAYNAMATQEEHPLIPYLRENLIDKDAEQVFFDKGKFKEGCFNIYLYKKAVAENSTAEIKSEKFEGNLLYLTDREIAFPLHNKRSGTDESSREKPLITYPKKKE